jgi:hypothetical protein
MAERTRRRWSGERRSEAAEREESAPERDARLRERGRALEASGWTGSPLVVHGDEVLNWNDDFDAARIIGLEDMVPRVTLEEVFAEAGMDMSQISSPEGEERGAPEREFFEDYLRSLPEHIRDKYGI